MSALVITVNKLVNSPVAGDVENRIFPTAALQGAVMPYLIVSKPDEQSRLLLAGAGKYPRSRVSIECIAATAAEADRLGKKVYDAFATMINEVVNDGQSPPSSYVATITPADFDFDDYSDERTSFRRVIDFYVDWNPQ